MSSQLLHEFREEQRVLGVEEKRVMKMREEKGNKGEKRGGF